MKKIHSLLVLSLIAVIVLFAYSCNKKSDPAVPVASFAVHGAKDTTVVRGNTAGVTMPFTISSNSSSTSIVFSIIGFPVNVHADLSNYVTTPVLGTTLKITADSSAIVGTYPITLTAATPSESYDYHFNLTVK